MSDTAAPGNLLRFETSPYLLQHRDNPVHWRGWNEAALAEARRLDRPILLSIGYAACHWCHVMAHESFEDPDVAEVMNRLFVNIKVDREERPDIDQVYMAALHALGDQGGWPLTMFLTPDARPIWGGTYFPPTARFGRPGFVDVLEQIAALYCSDRDALERQGAKITAHLAAKWPTPAGTLSPTVLDAAADAILRIMDPVHGGTKGAPKFPNAPVLDFLSRSAERTGRDDLEQIVVTSLEQMANGGIFDHVGGGFARYATDERWLVPHFEKMLSDNGLLLQRLALQLPAHPQLFRDRIEATIGWMVAEMRLPGGGLAASLDADSDGHEGSFYVWTPEALRQSLTEADGGFIAALYDIHPGGNWEGVSIPNRLHPHPPLSDAEEARRQRILTDLAAARSHRPRPERDDKQLADWNAHAIHGLALCGMILRRPDWLDLADAAYRFVSESIAREGRLGHARRGEGLVFPGFSSDLAAMSLAAIALHQATQRPFYLADAERFLATLDRHHLDGSGTYCLAADDGEALIVRRSDRIDDAVPNPHGMAAEASVRLWALTGDDSHRARADAIFDASAGEITANVFGSASLLAAFDLRLRVRTVLILVPGDAEPRDLVEAVTGGWRSNLVLDVRGEDEALPMTHPAHGRRAVGGAPTAYLCSEGRCSLPVTTAEALQELLRA